jgi:hypothetical protein
MAKLFLSHASSDKTFVRTLKRSLERLGHDIWLDETNIQVGVSIPKALQTGIEAADFVAVVLSKNSVESGWVEEEWQAKYWDGVSKRQVTILPVLLEDCKIPTFLRHKRYADFRGHYEVGLVQLANSLTLRPEISGVTEYFADFVDIGDEWERLFKNAHELDLVIMYGRTWRNTYLKHIRNMLKRPGGQLRIVLPEVKTASPLLRLYAERLNTTERTLFGRIEDAKTEFKDLRKWGHVEIYTTPFYLNHALYLFDHAGVLAFYAFRTHRCPTPALVVREGDLLNFLRKDFEWLVAPENPTRRVFARQSKRKS